MSCLYTSKLKLSVALQKRNWNFAFAFEHLWLDFELLNLLFFLNKIASRNSWETAQLFKMLCDNAHLTVQQFWHDVVSPEFLATLSFPNLQEARSLFGEYLIFFHIILKTEHLITLVNSNAASREPQIIFIALMVSPSISWRAWPWQYFNWTQSHFCTLLLQF